jgi:hypothetical protein
MPLDRHLCHSPHLQREKAASVAACQAAFREALEMFVHPILIRRTIYRLIEMGGTSGQSSDGRALLPGHHTAQFTTQTTLRPRADAQRPASLNRTQDAYRIHRAADPMFDAATALLQTHLNRPLALGKKMDNNLG